MNNFKWFIGTFGALILAFGVWAHDARYVTIAGLQEFATQQQVDEYGDRIDELTLKKSLGLTSEFEDALLNQLKEKLDRIQ